MIFSKNILNKTNDQTLHKKSPMSIIKICREYLACKIQHRRQGIAVACGELLDQEVN
jgi:hypothetical protein